MFVLLSVQCYPIEEQGALFVFPCNTHQSTALLCDVHDRRPYRMEEGEEGRKGKNSKLVSIARKAPSICLSSTSIFQPPVWLLHSCHTPATGRNLPPSSVTSLLPSTFMCVPAPPPSVLSSPLCPLPMQLGELSFNPFNEIPLATHYMY